jgi:hypothetical protein
MFLEMTLQHRTKDYSRIWMIVTLVSLLTLLSFGSIPVDASYSWTSLGGLTISSPAVTGIYRADTGGHVRVDVVVRGSDNGVYHRYYNWTTGWSSWISLNGKTLDQPAVAYAQYNYKDTLHVVVRGMDNALYYKKFDIASATWDASWTKLDPIAEAWYAGSAPVLVKYSGTLGDNLLLFFRGTNNYLYYARWHNYWANFAGKTWLKGQTPDIPAVNVYGETIHIVVRGMDNGIYYKNGSLLGLESTGTIDWSASWQKLPGSTLSAPTLVRGEGIYSMLSLIVRGSDNAIYLKWYYDSLNSWTPWDPWGGKTTERPALWISPGPVGGVWYLYVRGTDNGVYRRYAYFQGGIWKKGAWTYMNGKTSSAPTIDQSYLCVRGTNNVPYLIMEPT